MSNPLVHIREGMTVLDRTGDKIGSVEAVKMSDENPDTSAVEQLHPDSAKQRNDTLLDNIMEAFRTDDVPEPLREQLLRKGFMRVDADGIFASDRYVMPEQIAGVQNDDVMLRVSKSDLVKKH